VLSFDDFPWTSDFEPRLTAIAQPSHEMGRRAMEVLLSAMDLGSENAAESAGQVVVLKAELRIRESTAPPRSSSAVM